MTASRGISSISTLFSAVFLMNRSSRTKKAVDETIRICKDRDVLKVYLAREEVTELMFGYFNMEEQLEYLRQEERAEGEAIGTLRTLVNLVKQGLLSPENAAKQANMTVAEFEKQAALLPV